jgi:hypothetical protein
MALREKTGPYRLQGRKCARAALPVQCKDEKSVDRPECMAMQDAGHKATLHRWKGQRTQMRMPGQDDRQAHWGISIQVCPQTNRPT